jgi:hypothetical protein
LSLLDGFSLVSVLVPSDFIAIFVSVINYASVLI